MDDTRETVHTFLDKISQALLSQEEWIETSPEIIRHYNRNGLNGAKYFIYQGIRVCEAGQLEAVQDELNRSMNDRAHGNSEAKVL